MPLDHSLIGVESEPAERSWDSTDAILYALGVGAGLGDPLGELEFTTENSEGVEQKVLPTFGVLIARGGARGRRLGDFDPSMLVHAEQELLLYGPLPVRGTGRTTSKVTGIWDKGSGALVATEATAVDAAGAPLVTTRSSVFIRGEGGFGGERGPSSAWERPAREPDEQVEYTTRPEQALLYRLSGDRNPLHSDPGFARRARFPRPILHGLCTYGFTGRALLHTLCDSDPGRFRSMRARFSHPVFPGETLTVSMWVDGSTARFQTSTDEGGIVVDHGRFEFARGD
ncbi:MAG: MaoC family dehydratase N-terminal domain-containing protein [Candidatus Dormibacteraeota bacterium]|nr:MaoC family dehydratase N-terminal domain-containing protein [Candidatus Dormibacteraeota bacterium]MBO0745090.1 MaoC family dehydratase N-terminal domain-containing protein [Candidatus Dormibacteraeota bacterium]